ncbi:MAG: IS630 family transposase [Candidatus Thiodiazotropha sp.]
MDKRTENSILSVDFRKLLVRKIINLGGNVDTCVSPRGAYLSVSKELGIHHSTVKNIWMRFCVTKSYHPAPHSGGRKVKLLPADIRYIQYLVRETPSISRGEIKEKLLQFCNVDVSPQAISNVLKKLNMTRKIMVRPAKERFTDNNLRYMQAFIDTLNRLDASKIKFFDESGFSVPDVFNPRYGRSQAGERAIEIRPYAKRPNVTLNLLISLNGVAYATVHQGASDTDTFIQFVLDAVNATTNNGDFALKPGDYLVLDNCPVHHNRAQQVLAPFLDRLGIEYIFTPTYSPDLNPVEICFQHIKNIVQN